LKRESLLFDLTGSSKLAFSQSTTGEFSMTTIATKIAFSVLGAAGISLLSLAPASAVIFVEPIVTTQNQDIINTGRNPRRLGPELQPGQVIEYGVPDVANNLLNATGQNIGSLVFTLETLSYSNPNSTPAFNNEPVQWGDVDGDGKIGFSNLSGPQDIFKDVTLAGDTITFSGGVIPDGTVFYNLFRTQPNLIPGAGIIPAIPAEITDRDGPISVSSYYTTAVPEPSSALGALALGALTIGWQLKKHKKKQTLASKAVKI
jgi:hypothetical protein